jgi:hypothetical protein
MGSLGPAGAALGLGMNAMGAPTGPGNSASPNASGSGSAWDSLPMGLASLYMNNQASKGIGNMLGGLQGLYSQNSPYSQALRQQLERRDAAGGRRSQYGPREVELQAKLAQMASNQIPAMTNLMQMQNQQRNQRTMDMLTMFNKAGGGQALGNGLRGLWNSGVTAGVSNGMLPLDNSSFAPQTDNPFQSVDDGMGIWGG